jgi:carboxymethylenebutenolidase
MPDVIYEAAPERALRAYVVRPRGEGPWPGVVVVMDALGLSDDIRLAADRLATVGFLAFAPDLYSGRGIRCVLATLSASRPRRDLPGRRSSPSVARCPRGLHRPARDHRVLHGRGLRVAVGAPLRVSVASVNYGEVPADALQRLAGACPIVASYGARDRGLRGRAQHLENALQTLGIEHDVKEYPDAGHSFMNRINVGPGLGQLVKFIGLNYRHESAEDSWRRILDFFDAHLRA